MVDTATTDFGQDYDHSNQLPIGDKSRPFISSVVADDSMVCTVACFLDTNCISVSHAAINLEILPLLAESTCAVILCRY